MTLLIVWCLISIPASLFMGAFIRAGQGPRED